MEFKIDRRKWLRGEGWNKSRLLRESDGKMCCLGQVALQCGLTESAIMGIAVPYSTATGEWRKFPAWIKDGSSYILREAMTINDKQDISDEVREVALKNIFKSAGDSITFNH